VPYVALITGASSGIGEATARRLAREPDVRLVLVARRAERLRALAEELGNASVIAADLSEPDAPAQVAAALAREHQALHLLVNNAGARWAAEFADGGYANVERHMRLNFEAPVRLTQELLPLLRATAAASGPLAAGSAEAGQRAGFGGRPLRAPVAIVNVTSTAARIARRGAGAYSAAKAALAAWGDALALEERAHGVHVGDVLPGFIATEGFPQAELRARPLTRWAVSTPQAVAEAILDAGPGGAAERYVPRYYWLGALARLTLPALVRRGAGAGVVTTGTATGTGG